jgi:hypothetical protein
MSHESAEFEGDELLRAIGQVRAPEPRVLEDAREALWSAVVRDMPGLGPGGERTAGRRQAGGSRGERKTATGEGEC